MIRTLRITGLCLALAWASAFAYTLEQFHFDSDEQEQDFRILLEELRCVVCQNETLAGSQADVAQIMREEVYRLVKSGSTQAEVKKHLVARYGDFVLYNPPLKPSTYPLWFGPFILAGIAGFFLVRIILRRRSAREEDLSEAERARLDALLAEQNERQEADK